MKRITKHLLTAAAAGCLMMGVPAANADIGFNNDGGTGDHKWETATNWSTGTLPGSTDTVNINHDATVNSTQTVKQLRLMGATLDVLPGADVTVSGSMTAGTWDDGSTGTLNIAGGQLTTPSIGPSGKNGIHLNLSGGTLNLTTRIDASTTLNAGPPDHTQTSSFTLSGGTFNGSNATSNFDLFGPSADHRASFNVIGSAGSFSLKHNLILSDADSTTSADVNFTFGTTPTLTTIHVAVLKIQGNALTIDFSNINRPTSAAAYSVTLFDASYAAIDGDFAAPTFLGLGAGETASLARSTDDKQYLLNFTLAPVPEPATLALLAVGGVMMMPSRKRRPRRL